MGLTHALHLLCECGEGDGPHEGAGHTVVEGTKRWGVVGELMEGVAPGHQVPIGQG